VFTVADALLLRRLPVEGQDRLVVLAGATPDGRIDNWPLDLQGARDFAGRSRTLARTAFFSYYGAAPLSVREGDRISRLRRALVSGDYFAVLGARPVLGRALRPEDDALGAAPVLVLSHRAWQERFGGAPDVIGRRIVMHEDGVAYTVVGVMPQGLDHPRGTDAWVRGPRRDPRGERAVHRAQLIGRLAPGATPADAAAELTGTTGARARRRRAPAARRGARSPSSSSATRAPRCSRSPPRRAAPADHVHRRREPAARARAGAGARGGGARGARRRARARVGQLVTEHALLAVAGGALGVAVGRGGGARLRGVRAAGLSAPRRDRPRRDGARRGGRHHGGGDAAVRARAGRARVARGAERRAAGRRAHGAGRGTRLAREALVAGQVALALVVLSAAGLIGRSLLALQRAELAFEPARLVLAELALRSDLYDTPAKQLALLERLEPAVQAIPGVRAVTPVVAAPFSGRTGGTAGRWPRGRRRRRRPPTRCSTWSS
jgi:hypothetical protein